MHVVQMHTHNRHNASSFNLDGPISHLATLHPHPSVHLGITKGITQVQKKKMQRDLLINVVFKARIYKSEEGDE